MLRRIIALSFLCIIIVIYWQMITPEVPDTDIRPVVKIGVIYPMKEDGDHLENAAKVATEIFQEDIAKQNLRYNYQFFLEDNQLKLPQIISSVHKLIDINKVDVLITFSSNYGKAVSPIAETAKVLHLSIATDSAIAAGKYNFILASALEEESQDMFAESSLRNEFVKKFKIKTGKIATAYSKYLYSIMQIVTNAYEAQPAGMRPLHSEVAKKIISSTSGMKTIIGELVINKEGVIHLKYPIKNKHNNIPTNEK